MKVKTSVTLSEELLHAIDAQAGQSQAQGLVRAPAEGRLGPKAGLPGAPRMQRSAFIEAAAWSYLRARERQQRDARDLAIIDANAERLNAEALDALDYQAAL